MANKIVGQRLVDTNKHVITKIVIVSDGTNEANTVLIDASTLRFALNTSGKIMTANVNPKTKYNTTIKRIFGFLKSNTGSIRLQWHGDANSEIVVFGGGSQFEYTDEVMSGSVTIPNPEANSSGDILITTQGLVNGDVATIVINQRKDNNDFDAGQTADPYAFNRG